MARDQIGSSSDAIGLFVAIQNANAAKDDALQAASGVTEGSSDVGAIPGTLPAGAPASTDTLKTLALKAWREALASISTADVRHSGANSGRDADLGNDYDYQNATSAVIGTTNITTSGQATALGYPSAGVFTVQSTYSTDVSGATVGRVKTVLISDGTAMWVTLKENATWTPLEDLLQRPFVVAKNATTDWGAAVAGVYTLNILQAEHGMGANIAVEAWDTTSVPGYRIQYLGAAVEAATGDITITAQETPDERVGLLVLVRRYA